MYTQRNLIRLNQTEIRVYLPFSNWNSKRTVFVCCSHTVPNQPDNGKYNLISDSFNKIPQRVVFVADVGKQKNKNLAVNTSQV